MIYSQTGGLTLTPLERVEAYAQKIKPEHAAVAVAVLLMIFWLLLIGILIQRTTNPLAFPSQLSAYAQDHKKNARNSGSNSTSSNDSNGSSVISIANTSDTNAGSANGSGATTISWAGSDKTSGSSSVTPISTMISTTPGTTPTGGSGSGFGDNSGGTNPSTPVVVIPSMPGEPTTDPDPEPTDTDPTLPSIPPVVTPPVIELPDCLCQVIHDATGNVLQTIPKL